MPESDARLWAILVAATSVGVLAGLFGVGGGVLLIPLLVFLFSFEQHKAQGTSLIALVPPTGLLAFFAYYRAHEVNVKVGMLLIPGVFLGGMLGGNIAERLSPRRMRRVFAAFLFALGLWEIISVWFK